MNFDFEISRVDCIRNTNNIRRFIESAYYQPLFDARLHIKIIKHKIADSVALSLHIVNH